MNRARLAMAALLAALTMVNAGCIAVLAGGAMGAAGYAYAKAEKKRTVHAPVTQVADAARGSLAQLGVRVDSYRIDQTGAVIKGETATGKNVRLEIKPQTAGSSVEVRVGAFGDDVVTDMILSGIEQRVAAPAASGTAPATAAAETLERR